MECLLFFTIRKPLPVSRVHMIRTVEYTLRSEHKNGTISVHVIGDSKMKQLNGVHRGKNKTTDVLSFPAQYAGAKEKKPVKMEKWGGKQEQDLGDIFISAAQIRRQAKVWEVSAAEEFTRMLVHGVLHILGYDHMEDKEAKVMFGKQERYLTAVLKK